MYGNGKTMVVMLVHCLDRDFNWRVNSHLGEFLMHRVETSNMLALCHNHKFGGMTKTKMSHYDSSVLKRGNRLTVDFILNFKSPVDAYSDLMIVNLI